MAVVVLHRLTDWPVFPCLRPLLDALGVSPRSFDYWHWFTSSREATDAIVASLPEQGARPHELDALLAASHALASFAPELARIAVGDRVELGYHDCATGEVLAATARARGDEVVWLSEVAGELVAFAHLKMKEAILPQTTVERHDVLTALLERDAERSLATPPRSALHPDDLLHASYFGHLDEVLSRGDDTLARLFGGASRGLPGGRLAKLVAQRWCVPRMASLRPDAVLAASALDPETLAPQCHEELAGRAHRGELACGDLLACLRSGVAPPFTKDRDALRESMRRCVANHPATLAELHDAHLWGVLDGEALDAALPRAFQDAMEAGFVRPGTSNGDPERFDFAAPRIAVSDPDLVLRGWARLVERFNEHGLRQYARAWDRALPRTGYSADALAEVAGDFGRPSERSAARLLGPILRSRGIEVRFLPPPPLASVHATLEVGTDVGHVVIGSISAIEALQNADPADWPRLARRHRCIAIDTGADGDFVVSVTGLGHGETPSAPPAAVLIGTFPLRVTEDSLTVSGIVGSGGDPTSPFPSGDYGAAVWADGCRIAVFVGLEPSVRARKGRLPRLP
jgi:hypothetical protein